MKTYKQMARQSTEFRKNGKYAKMNPCEICGGSCGAVYYSAENCNETGINVCLCQKCAKIIFEKEGCAKADIKRLFNVFGSVIKNE